MAKTNEGRIARRSRTGTNQRNTQKLLQVIATLKVNGAIDLVQDNFDLLETYVNAQKIDIDLDLVLDALRTRKSHETINTTLETIRPILHRVVKKEGYQNLVTHNLGIKFEDADKIAARDIALHRQRAEQRRKNIQQVFSATKTLASLILPASVRAAWAASKYGARLTQATANLMEGVGSLMLGRIGWKATAVAGTLFSGAYITSPTDVAANFPHLMDSAAKNAFHDACLENPGAMANRLDAAYALAMRPTSNDSTARYLYDGSWMAARHGVPPQIIAEFAKFESYSGRQVLNTLSSASGPLQIVDLTKFLYVKTYGKKTFGYKEAFDRLKAETASPEDRNLITAIDTVASMSHSEIKRTIKNPYNMSAPVLEAMRLVDRHSFASELFALHLKASIPSKTFERLYSMSPKELHEKVIVPFYVKEHNLGAPTTKAIERIIKANRALSLTDPAIGTIVGDKWAEKLSEIAAINPALHRGNPPAHNVFNAMGEKFSLHVGEITDKIQKEYMRAATAGKLCTDPVKAESARIPTKMPRYKAALASIWPSLVFPSPEQPASGNATGTMTPILQAAAIPVPHPNPLR